MLQLANEILSIVQRNAGSSSSSGDKRYPTINDGEAYLFFTFITSSTPPVAD
jgi:hypothetical protein